MLGPVETFTIQNKDISLRPPEKHFKVTPAGSITQEKRIKGNFLLQNYCRTAQVGLVPSERENRQQKLHIMQEKCQK